MSTRKLCWPEIMRIWAQWAGIGLAAIPTGLILGLLLRYGASQTSALALALPVGFALALTFWILIARWIAIKPVAYTMAVSPNVISLEPAAAIAATAILCLTLYSFHGSMGIVDQPRTASGIPHAFPQL